MKNFFELTKERQLKIMKEKLDNLTNDFQHTEIVEISVISEQLCLIKVWEKQVSSINWPKFTDYIHTEVFYKLPNANLDSLEFEFVEGV